MCSPTAHKYFCSSTNSISLFIDLLAASAEAFTLSASFGSMRKFVVKNDFFTTFLDFIFKCSTYFTKLTKIK